MTLIGEPSMPNSVVRQAVVRASLDEALAPDAFFALAGGKVLGVVVPDFVSRACCELLCERLVRDHRLGGYATDDGAGSIKKLGTPLFEAAGRDPVKLERYDGAALWTIRALRELRRTAPWWCADLWLSGERMSLGAGPPGRGGRNPSAR
jgi:hypothetical protein